MRVNRLKSFTCVESAAVSILALLALCYGEIADVFSRHMLVHIALMTVVAPVLAGLLRKRVCSAAELASMNSLPVATALQAALFFAWHSPPGAGLAMSGHIGSFVMQATLLFSALWFWLAVFNQAGKQLWRAAVALLLTGKLFCLIAVLLTFAPRVLYGVTSLNPAMMIDLADQQLAGLLMITVCPLTYVLAAIVLIARWFQALCESQGDVSASAVASESGS